MTPLEPLRKGISQIKEVTNRCFTLKFAKPLSLSQLKGSDAWFASPPGSSADIEVGIPVGRKACVASPLVGI